LQKIDNREKFDDWGKEEIRRKKGDIGGRGGYFIIGSELFLKRTYLKRNYALWVGST
jgi:hypothetical protein